MNQRTLIVSLSEMEERIEPQMAGATETWGGVSRMNTGFVIICKNYTCKAHTHRGEGKEENTLAEDTALCRFFVRTQEVLEEGGREGRRDVRGRDGGREHLLTFHCSPSRCHAMLTKSAILGSGWWEVGGRVAGSGRWEVLEGCQCCQDGCGGGGSLSVSLYIRDRSIILRYCIELL